MNVTSKISVDLLRPNIGTVVNAMQGDGAVRCVRILLLAGGQPWEPPEDVQTAVSYLTPTMHKGLYNLLEDGTPAVSVTGNVAEVILAPQMLTQSGTVRVALMFNDPGLNHLTSFPFTVSVARTPAMIDQQTENYIRLQWLEDKLGEWLEKAEAALLDYAERAERAAATSGRNADAAALSEGNAAKSASQAAQSEENARQAAQEAAQDAQAAEDAAQAAAGSAGAAGLAAEASGKSAEAAALSEGNAADSAGQAAHSAESARQSAQEAVQDAQTAEAAAQATAGSADAAGLAAEAAERSADAAALSEGNAAESARQAAASEGSAQQAAAAAQEVVNTVAQDVRQLKDDLAAEQIARDAADNALRNDLTANAESNSVTKRRLDALWKLNQGVSYQFETDDAEAYSKTVPSGVKLASVQEIGGKTVTWNQHTEHRLDSYLGVKPTSNDDGSITLKGIFTGANFGYNKFIINRYETPEGHWIYAKLSPKTASMSTFAFAFSGTSGSVIYYDYGDGLLLAPKYGVNTLRFCVFDGGVGMEIDETFFPFLVDLTVMFGAGNEPTTMEDPRIAGIEHYVVENPELNYGQLVSADVESVLYDGAVIGTIPEAVRNLPGYGWSAGDVCNSIERTDTGWQYVQQVGSREYQEGDIVTDGVTTYYMLDVPVITDITDLMTGTLDAITVEEGGTMTFENAAQLPVPSSVEYLIALAEVG